MRSEARLNLAAATKGGIMKTMLICAVGLVLGVVLAAGQTQAVEGCKAKVSSKDGTITVKAKNVEGNTDELLWGGALGAERNVFSNNATCIVNGKAKNCTLGDPGERLATTPPASCMLYLADAGINTCSTYIKGCTPGTRPLWAVVQADGTLVRGRGVVSASTPFTGIYNIIFDQNVEECSFAAMLARPADAETGPGEIDAAMLFSDPNGVYLRTHNSSGTNTAYDFHLALTCP
jgi:hypothetical protein